MGNISAEPVAYAQWGKNSFGRIKEAMRQKSTSYAFDGAGDTCARRENEAKERKRMAWEEKQEDEGREGLKWVEGGKEVWEWRETKQDTLLLLEC